MRFFHWLARTAGYELLPLQTALEKKVYHAMIDRKMPIDRLYLSVPLDDMGTLRRVACTRWIEGKRWGLVILWNNRRAPITARKVTEVIVQLWDQFELIIPHVVMTNDKGWMMDDRGLTQEGD